MTNPPTEPHSLSGAVIRPAVIADAPAIRGIRNAAVRDSLALLEACRTAGDRTMVAQIEAGGAASIRLHEKAGFVLVGTIPAAGQKHGRLLDLTLMSRRIDRP